MEAPELLTPREVAQIFGVSRATVTRWAATDKVRKIRTPGGSYRISRQEVERFLAGEGNAA